MSDSAENNDAAGKILAGVRVVEISGLGPGPFCGMHFADLGADVICIERGDVPRLRSPVFRGKRSVKADLKTSEGRELVLALVEGADALIEGMRPGVMERLGLGPQQCHRRNPRLVYGRVTGWGQDGPMAQAAGHDANYAALAGALYFSGTPAEPPIAPMTLLADIGGGALYLAIGLLAGILRARSSGRGTVVDAAMVDGCAHMLHLLLGTQREGGPTGQNRGGNMHDGSHFFSTYRCADGEYITFAAVEPQFYQVMLEKLELVHDSRFAQQWDRSRWPELHAEVARAVAQRSRAEWTRLVEGSDACFAPVLRPTEAAEHPHNLARGTYFRGQGMLQAVPAPRFDGQKVNPGPVPEIGAHTEPITAAAIARDEANVWLPRPDRAI